MKKTFVSMAVLIAFSVAIVCCGGKKSASNQHRVSGLRFRAFVSNPLFPSGIGGSPVINIVDALQDIVSPATISLLGTSNQPGMMVVTQDLSHTMVFSPAGETITVIDNHAEAIATLTGGTVSVPGITLPGLTESMFVASDNVSAYAAVPSAPVTGQAPGAVIAMNLGTGAIRATIPVPAAHFIVGSPDGNHILVFSDNSDNVTVIATPLIGTPTDPRQPVGGIGGFHRPVWAIFTDNTTAYVFNCGAECGGTGATDMTAGISTFTIGNSAPSTIAPLSAATYGLLVGSTLYVAGTPPQTACGPGTEAKTCGTLNVVDAASLKPTSNPVLITDGYHDRMAMGSNGQLFIGAHSCTSINILGGEVRGCLSIFNSNNSSVVIPPQVGDATGIQPITGRNVVYVCEGGAFQMYNTTTDQTFIPPTSSPTNGIITNIVGQSYDVKLVDPPVD
ncbi:MAG TPA: hypothetical protein VEF05_15930 [Terriglobales bacterium]|nr:hypothetical protein [Terriglobales bacterium]